VDRSWYYPDSFMEGLKKTTKSLRIDGVLADIRTKDPQIYKSRTSLIYQPTDILKMCPYCEIM
jgi:hypothetical protein